MPRDKSFHDYVVHDLLNDTPGINSRAMFGGWGIYKDGKMFGLISESELYLKVNESNIANFKKVGSRPFEYARKGKKINLSYWSVSEEILENRDQFLELTTGSIEANTN